MVRTFHLVMNIPSPYRIHATRELWHQLEEKQVSLMVHYMSDMSRGHDERPLSWRNPQMDYPYKYWPDWGFGCHHFNPGMIRYLRRANPYCLVVGSPFDTFTGLLLSGFCNAQIKCAGTEGNCYVTGEMHGIKGWLKRWAFSHYQYVDLPGQASIEYMKLHQALTRRKMPTPIIVPNFIETGRFLPKHEWSEEKIHRTRMDLGVPDGERLCLIPARLSPEKGLSGVIELLEPAMLEGWRIIIIGEGPLKAELLDLIRKRDLSEYVIIRDFIEYANMPSVYAAADLFLLPSLRDHNPLTVIEAINTGLPVAVSVKAGNVGDAVNEGVNGWKLPIDDKMAFRAVLEEVFNTDMERLREMGRHSYEDQAPFWDVKKGIAHFISALGI